MYPTLPMTAPGWVATPVGESSDEHQLGDAEVQDLHPAVGRQEEVLGFEVAMDDPGGVRSCQASCHLRAEVDDELTRQRRRLLKPGAQRVALEQLHHEKRRSVIGVERPDIVDGQDVRVIERASRTRFLLESQLTRPVAAERMRQHFDRDLPAQTGIERAIHLTHAALSNQLTDFIRSETLTCGQRRRWRIVTWRTGLPETADLFVRGRHAAPLYPSGRRLPRSRRPIRD